MMKKWYYILFSWIWKSKVNIDTFLLEIKIFLNQINITFHETIRSYLAFTPLQMHVTFVKAI